MADIRSNTGRQGSREKPDRADKSWLGKVLESMDVVGDAIIDFAKNPFAQPKYLTAFGGLLALVSTMFPWTYLTYYGQKTQGYAGFTEIPGVLTAVLGSVIVFVAIFIRTKPGLGNSRASSGLALLGLLIDIVLRELLIVRGEYEPGYGMANGFGHALSVIALFLTFAFGFIPNPMQALKQ